MCLRKQDFLDKNSSNIFYFICFYDLPYKERMFHVQHLQTEIDVHLSSIKYRHEANYDSSSDSQGSMCKIQYFAIYLHHSGQKRNVPKLPFPFHLNWFPTIETNISCDIKLSSACVIPSSLNLFFFIWPFCVEAATSSFTIS